MKKLWHNHPGWIIFFAAVTLRITAITVAWLMHRHPVPLEYEVVASNWLDGNGFVYFHYGTWYRSFLNPPYGFLSIAVYTLFGHHQLFMLFTNAIFAGLLSVTIYSIGSFIDKRTGILAAFLTMMHPGIFYYDVFYLHPLSMDAFLFAFIVLAFMRLAAKPSPANELTVGLALGIQMYERGTIAFFVPPALVWLKYFLTGNERIIKWLKRCAVILTVMTALVMPWMIRNFLIHKELVPICTPMAEILWRGNNPLATGTAYSANGTPMFFASPQEFQKKVTSLDELGQAHLFRQEALRFIKESPGRFIMLTLHKIRLFWWFSPLTGIEYKFRQIWLVKMAYSVMFMISLSGIILMIRRKVRADLVSILLIMFSAVTLGQSLFYVQQKHRWGIEPLLFIFTAYAITACYKNEKQ